MMNAVYRSWCSRCTAPDAVCSAVNPHTSSPVIYRTTAASFCQPVRYSSPTFIIPKEHGITHLRARYTLLVQLERVSSSRWVSEAGSAVSARDWISRCASVSPRSVGGTVTGRHETECGQRLKPAIQSQRPTLAFAALSVCVLCFL